MDDLALHASLIGQQGSRAALNTPVLVIDLDSLDRNIATMAGLAKARGVELRPHAKTHKSVDIAKRQVAAGAIGFCCAKLGEAEALAEGGLSGLHLTSPVVTPQAIERLLALNRTSTGLSVVVDDPSNVAALGGAAGDTMLNVVIDIDPGTHRTGVVSAETAVALAQAIAAEPALHYLGVQCYCGIQQHIENYADRRAAIEERTAYLRTVIAALSDAGFAPEIVTGGGTGTHAIDLDLGVFTELQVGSYVFMDRQYNDCDLTGDGGSPFETSLFVDTSVVSANSPGLSTIDAGYKGLSTDGGSPVIAAGAPAAANFLFMGDEHGALIGASLPVGQRVTLVVPHCDPTVNLYDFYHVVRDNTLVEIWPVSARGRSR
jgi:3-hydroxy-D-aspartate aldolase